jgi:hypothetical protein
MLPICLTLLSNLFIAVMQSSFAPDIHYLFCRLYLALIQSFDPHVVDDCNLTAFCKLINLSLSTYHIV